ncbi:MAG: DUF2147 domain-containing protein [Pseudomonadota bacterium]
MLLLPIGPALAAEADDVLGRYWNPDRDGVVEIYGEEGVFNGRIIWSAQPMIDAANPEKALRGRNMLGVPFLTGFRFDGDDRWVGGRVYAPDDGRTYRGKLWLEGKDLKMRGFVGVSLLGRTATFPAYPENELLPERGYRVGPPIPKKKNTQ